ncbi:hypothetical protein QJS10_CPB17g01304 [Acorus calamus]|uniref:Uncharacterized protein n=1 Tax=Acorus calamus TaxID=4465 RepID=A0AAV9CTX1_ACOCL|nr:hypothetical protein QJS10_CPB17g01304 [Acorus calamus]
MTMGSRSFVLTFVRTGTCLGLGRRGQCGYSHVPDELTYGVDMKRIRWCGILQFSFELFRLAGACILIVYLAMLYGMYVPNWEFRVCNSNRKDYGKVLTACTDVSPHEGPIRADAPSWFQAPFEPEGILRILVLLLESSPIQKTFMPLGHSDFPGMHTIEYLERRCGLRSVRSTWAVSPHPTVDVNRTRPSDAMDRDRAPH